MLEIDGRRAFRYESVYFDTPELTSYRLTAHRRRRRFKVRTRTYLDSGLCWLEVKTPGGARRNVKHRLPYHRGTCAPTSDPARGFVDEIARPRSRCRPAARIPSCPTLITRYRRTTLLCPATASRVTIDTACVGDARQVSVRCRNWPSWRPRPLDRLPGRPLLWRTGHRPVPHLQVRHRAGRAPPGTAREPLATDAAPALLPCYRLRTRRAGRCHRSEQDLTLRGRPGPAFNAAAAAAVLLGTLDATPAGGAGRPPAGAALAPRPPLPPTPPPVEAPDDLVGDIIFSVPSGTFQGQMSVSLSTRWQRADPLHHGRPLPAAHSPVYTGPLQLPDHPVAGAGLRQRVPGPVKPGTSLYVARRRTRPTICRSSCSTLRQGQARPGLRGRRRLIFEPWRRDDLVRRGPDAGQPAPDSTCGAVLGVLREGAVPAGVLGQRGRRR